jgi:catechol 2,3-dioxygenase-like lactoylglutathione lyase family enzyme
VKSHNKEDIEMQDSRLGFQYIKAIALAATDLDRAATFYGEKLGLAPAFEGGRRVGYFLGQTILMLKDNWYGTPTDTPNPRITIATDDAMVIEAALKERGIATSDPVQAYDDGFYVGGFLDSEGNKLWFCSPIERK